MAMRFEECDRDAATALLTHPAYRKTFATLSSKDAAKAVEQFSVIIQVARETIAATNLPDVHLTRPRFVCRPVLFWRWGI